MTTAPGRLRRPLGLVAVAAGLLFPGVALTLDAAFGVEVTILSRRWSAEEEREQRRLRDPRDDVAEIYGTPEGRPVRVLFPRRESLIEPREEPGRRLLAVDRLRGDTVLQSSAVRFAGLVAGAVFLLAGGILVLLAPSRGAPSRGSRPR